MPSQQINEGLTFPCEFPIKVMGESSDLFEKTVYHIIRQHLDDELPEHAIQTKHSAQGRYMAITVTIRATSREQLDRIYYQLTASQRVMIAL